MVEQVAVRVGSTWLHSLGFGHVGDLEYTTVYGDGGGGLLTASFTLGLPAGFTHPSLRQGALVQMSVGSWPICSAGILAEPDRAEWRFTVDGVKRLAEKMAAVDGSGNPSTDLSVVIPAAVARGLPWSYYSSGANALPAGAVSTASEDAANLNTVRAVLDKYCEVNGKRWRIDRHGYLRFTTDTTTATLALTPGVPSMATADDDYVMRVYTRRVSGLNTDGEPNAWAANMAEDTAAGARWGVSESIEDITEFGLLDTFDGQDIAAAILAAGRARPAWAEGVAPAAYQLTTLGGTEVPHWLADAGSMVRHHGWLDSDGNLAFGGTVDWVIGSKTWRQSDGSLTLTPVGLAARTTAQVAAKQAREMQRSFR